MEGLATESPARIGASLPRLLYLADVPVQATMHGSVALFRLLQHYPRDRLLIVEGEADSLRSDPALRIPGVPYRAIRLGLSRPLRTRFHRYLSPIATGMAPLYAGETRRLVRAFRPEAVLTVVNHYFWITAAHYASGVGLPLHLILHDDVANTHGRTALETRMIERQLRRWYPAAASRLCVSPFMAEEYQARYGAAADVLYPSRAAETLLYDAPPARLGGPCDPFTVVFGGSLYLEYARALQRLATALRPIGGRVVAYGGRMERADIDGLLDEPNLEWRGRLATTDELIRRYHEEGHAIFVPMSYAAGDRRNMEISFPSKLADATAAALPLLIDGPEYCSAVRWARDNEGVAEIVTEPTVEALAAAVERLRQPGRQLALAAQAVKRGHEYFAQDRAARVLARRLSGDQCAS